MEAMVLASPNLGRIVMTVYLLDPIFRRRQRQRLNKGEERNSLSRRLHHGTDGGFRTGDYLAQFNAASCLNLLIALISVSIALEYQRLLEGKGGSERVPATWLRTLSTFSTDGVVYLVSTSSRTIRGRPGLCGTRRLRSEAGREDHDRSTRAPMAADRTSGLRAGARPGNDRRGPGAAFREAGIASLDPATIARTKRRLCRSPGPDRMPSREDS